MESPSLFVQYYEFLDVILVAISVIFLSDDQVRKQSAMPKRGQKMTSNEGSTMAKARPCLVARDPEK